MCVCVCVCVGGGVGGGWVGGWVGLVIVSYALHLLILGSCYTAHKRIVNNIESVHQKEQRKNIATL